MMSGDFNTRVLGGLCGIALGLAMAIAGLAPAFRTAVETVLGDGQAEVAVAFDPSGRVQSSVLVRSTGSGRSDAAAREAALQLANLQPPAEVAGRTLVYRAQFGAAFD